MLPADDVVQFACCTTEANIVFQSLRKERKRGRNENSITTNKMHSRFALHKKIYLSLGEKKKSFDFTLWMRDHRNTYSLCVCVYPYTTIKS